MVLQEASCDWNFREYMFSQDPEGDSRLWLCLSYSFATLCGCPAHCENWSNRYGNSVNSHRSRLIIFGGVRLPLALLNNSCPVHCCESWEVASEAWVTATYWCNYECRWAQAKLSSRILICFRFGVSTSRFGVACIVRWPVAETCTWTGAL